jgi:hypothetical protein
MGMGITHMDIIIRTVITDRIRTTAITDLTIGTAGTAITAITGIIITTIGGNELM